MNILYNHLFSLTTMNILYTHHRSSHSKDTLCNHMLSFTPMRCCVLSPVGQFGTSASDESHVVHTAFGLVRCTRFGAFMLQISPGYTFTCMNAKRRHLRSQCIVANHLILPNARSIRAGKSALPVLRSCHADTIGYSPIKTSQMHIISPRL